MSTDAIAPLSSDTSKSPGKRNLGSPMRKASTNRPTTGPDLEFVSLDRLLSTSSRLAPPPGIPRDVATLTKTQTLPREDLQSANDATTTKCLRPYSPLKKPSRRVPSTIEHRPDSNKGHMTGSPLKKRPGRAVLSSTFEDSHDATRLVTIVPRSDTLDEVSLSTPTKTARSRSTGVRPSTGGTKLPVQTAGRRVSPASRSHKRSKVGAKDLAADEDEIAAQSYTPIRIPVESSTAMSPPSDDILSDEDDLWTPSVPLSLHKSFAELALEPSGGVSPRTTPSHIFFTEDGDQVEQGNSLPKEDISAKATQRSTTIQVATERMTVYVDCKSAEYTDAAQHFSSMLSELGAKTLLRWNWNPETQTTPSRLPKVGLTHVVFFEGTIRTLKKVRAARKLGLDIKCVGLSWVMQCNTSRKLTVGTDGHEVDIEAELTKLNREKTTSKQVTETAAIMSPVKLEQPELHANHREFLSPVKFADDEVDNVFSSEHIRSERKTVESSVSAAHLILKTTVLTDFEHKQLALARRNSAKFRPPVSSPLSKKAWRA